MRASCKDILNPELDSMRDSLDLEIPVIRESCLMLILYFSRSFLSLIIGTIHHNIVRVKQKVCPKNENPHRSGGTVNNNSVVIF